MNDRMNFLERIAGLPPKRLALLAAELNARLERLEQRSADPIAVIGIGCRFPGGVNDPDSFWRLLIEGRDAIVEVPPDRWDIDALFDPDPDSTGKMNTRWGGFLDGIDQFDPEFFGISPREATGMDPQQRVLLEVTWEALENAGLCPDRLTGSQTGVFVGVCNNDYFLKQFETGRDSVDAYVATGNAHSVASGRISYLLGLQGPSLSVDTGCSASLVAVHLACQSLRAGECRAALAGGVNLILMPDTTVVLSKAHMMSPNGRCKAFDASADGFVRSEGCGVIVLKRLSDARADGDRILALIRGTASNQDGRSNGLTAPNGPSQVAVIREALANASLEAGDVDYIEAHGTGTSLGDPIEAHALAEVFGPGRSLNSPLRIGSVKTNFGHAESAAGIAGLIKTILALRHEKVPPSLHLQKLNPHIDWGDLPIAVATAPTPWTRERGQRIAGVSSFGFSGTNAHVIVSDPPTGGVLPEAQNIRTLDNLSSPELLILSARSESALLELAGKYQQLFNESPDLNLVDVCRTGATGRSHFKYRLAILAQNLSEARERLASFRSGQKSAGIWSGRSIKSGTLGVVFMFTGQGSQYPGMGSGLFETQPVFRRELEKCAEILNPLLEIPLLEALFADGSRSDHRVDQTQLTQPALFALEYALAAMWRSWGLEPGAVLGHSVGEYVAACIAGVFSLEDGLRLIAERGRLMGSLPAGGAMAAIFTDESRVSRAIDAQGSDVAIACVNGPANVVVSGESVAVDRLLAELKNEGVQFRSLAVSHAFHSKSMDPILDSFQRVAASVQLSEPLVPIVSNVTGELATPGLMSAPEYWRRQIRNPVRFADSIRALRKIGHSVFLEIGPHSVLTGMARATAPEAEVVWTSSLNRGQQDWESLLEAVSTLYVEGVDLDWTGIPTSFAGKRASLPTYPFQRSRFWLQESVAVNSRKKQESRSHTGNAHPFLGERLDSPAIPGAVFEVDLGVEHPAFLHDHRIFGRPMMPSPVYIEMALAGAAAVANLARSESLPCELTNLHVREPLFLPEDGSYKVQLILDEAGEDGVSFQVCSRNTSEPAHGKTESVWRTNATGRVRIGIPVPEIAPPSWNREEVWARCQEEINPISLYESLIPLGLEFGDRFRGIASIRRRDGEAIAENRLPDSLAVETEPYRIHPAFLDSCFHLLGAALPADTVDCGYLLIGLERFTIYSVAPGRLWNHAVLRSPLAPTGEAFGADIRLYDDNGRLIAEILGLQLKRAPREAIARVAGLKDENWFYQIEWRRQQAAAIELKEAAVSSPSEFIPIPGLLAEKARGDLSAISAAEGLSIYGALIEQLEDLSGAFICRAFLRMGWPYSSGDHFTTQELAGRLGIVSTQRRLFERLLGVLSEEGVLTRDGDRWIVRKCPELQFADLQSEAYRLKQEFPACSAEITLTARCADRLDEVLRGTCDPLQLLFPGGDFDTANALYRRSPFARALNTVVRQVLVAATEKAPKNRPIRILEVGAGTGGTTSFLLPHLSAERTQYVFSDVSPLFLARARDEFRNHPFVSYQLLDIEKPPGEQGFEEQSFDVVIAANALHATCDLRTSLGYTVSLLASGGLLILLEATLRQRWVDLTFGMTDGWWRFQDATLRSDSPLLTAGQWTTLFQEMGLETTTDSSTGNIEMAQQAVLLGRKPVRIDSQETEIALGGLWLVLADNQGIGEQIADLLAKEGQKSVLVLQAEEYQFGSGYRATVNPLRPSDFQRLLLDASAHCLAPLKGVLNLWPMDEELSVETTAVAWEAAQQRIGAGVLHTAQALFAATSGSDARVWLATKGGQLISSKGGTNTEVCQPIQALTWGLGRVLSLENPSQLGSIVDLDPDASPQESAVAIWREIKHAGEEDAIAYRNGERLVPRLVRAEEPAAEPLFLCGDGTYLITGGLGGLGLRIANWMAVKGARHLVLVSRRDFPDRTLWPDLPVDDPHREAIEAIVKAEKLGTRITVARADVADENAMRQILNRVATEDYPLRGIAHCAVEMTGRSIRDLDLAAMQQMCRAKALGAWVLNRLTLGMELDFFVLFSSTTGLWGAAGLGHYAAANQALDMLAHWRRKRGLRALSVNWGTWEEMRVASKTDKEEFERAGLRPMPCDRALTALERLISADRTSGIVASVDWNTLRGVYEARRRRPLFAEIQRRYSPEHQRAPLQKSTAPKSNLTQELQNASPVRRREIVIGHLRSLVASVLGFHPSREIDLEQGLFDLGLDSLMAVELKGRLESSLGQELPSTLIFNYPNIRALTDYILCEALKFAPESKTEISEPQVDPERAPSSGQPVDDLSEEEIAHLLLKKLEEIK